MIVTAPPELRVLVLSLEYAEPWIFSGNGVYARALVQTLSRPSSSSSSQQQQRVRFLVVCGRPATATASQAQKETYPDYVQVCTVPLQVWFKLDRTSSWREFGEQVASSKAAQEVFKFDPHVAFGVDWSVKHAWDRLGLASTDVPLVYLCFRCFSAADSSSTDDKHEEDEDARFYAEMERGMLRASAMAVALSSCEADALQSLVKDNGKGKSGCGAPTIKIIPPPLRDDLHAMAVALSPQPFPAVTYLSKPRYDPPSPSSTNRQPPPPPRIYLTCVCRIVPCKRVLEGFVAVCESIKDFLQARRIVPYLVGPSFDGDEGYSLTVYQRLKRAFPGKQSIIRSEFVGAAQLAAIFQQSLVNIHPATWEPFGMTIIEAAAFAVPTLMHCQGVGAADLLPAQHNLSLASDLANAHRTGAVLKTALSQPASYLRLIGTRAQQAVLQWDSARWGLAVRHELLPNLPLSRTAAARVVAPQQSQHEQQQEQQAWPWIPLAEYLSAPPALVQRRVESWLGRHTEDSFAQVLRKRKPRLLQPFVLSADMLQWGHHFCRTNAMLAQVRFRFVPSRLPEKTFWGIFFLCVREVCGAASGTSSAFEQMERAVQVDDERGIQTMARALGASQLLASASALAFKADKVLVLTGFPCCTLGRSKQETDGPPGAVGLARALASLKKRVHVCVELASSDVMQACLASVFPPCSSQTSTSCSELFTYGELVTLEVFPPCSLPASATAEVLSLVLARVDELKSEFSERNRGHLIAIERCGPGLDGRSRTMRGRVLDDDLAPLHLLFEAALARTTAIGDGGNEVGMGNVHDLHLPSKESACVTECTYLLPCSVSNWGALSLCAALSLVAWTSQDDGDESLLLGATATIHAVLDQLVGSDEVLQRVIEACVEAGAADGITQEPDVLSVDGMPFACTLDVAQKLRALVVDGAL